MVDSYVLATCYLQFKTLDPDKISNLTLIREGLSRYYTNGAKLDTNLTAGNTFSRDYLTANSIPLPDISTIDQSDLGALYANLKRLADLSPPIDPGEFETHYNAVMEALYIYTSAALNNKPALALLPPLTVLNTVSV